MKTNELKGLFSCANRKRGFTLVEILVVIAIIAALTAIAIPMFHAHLEKTRNATDVYNAKILANSVRTYFLTNPDKLDEFIDVYGENPSGYRPYILVTDEVLAVSTDKTGFLLEALSASGLLGKEIRSFRFNGVLCKTHDSWKSYTIGFTVLDGELVMGFCGLTDKAMKVKRWTVWSGPDPTPFRDMCAVGGL